MNTTKLISEVNLLFVGSDIDYIRKYLSRCTNGTLDGKFSENMVLNVGMGANKIGSVKFNFFVADLDDITCPTDKVDYIILCINTDMPLSSEERRSQFYEVAKFMSYNFCVLGLGETNSYKINGKSNCFVSQTRASLKTCYNIMKLFSDIVKNSLSMEYIYLSE
jgi:hypothetical protein